MEHRGWTRWSLVVPSNVNRSMILQFHEFWVYFSAEVPQKEMWWLLGHFVIKLFPLDFQSMFICLLTDKSQSLPQRCALFHPVTIKVFVCFFLLCDLEQTDDSAIKRVSMRLKPGSNHSHKEHCQCFQMNALKRQIEQEKAFRGYVRSENFLIWHIIPHSDYFFLCFISITRA